MKIFDFHSHILPQMDDGSSSVAESLAMLQSLAEQGVYGIVATPHFYAQKESPAKFLQRRTKAWQQLQAHLPAETMPILLGAEVHYFEGIPRIAELDSFCMEHTNLFLLEMPVCHWSPRMVETVLELQYRRQLQVLLAHVERYRNYHNQEAMELLLSHGIWMQGSTTFFEEKPRTALRWFTEGYIHVLGSDAHNMQSRKPQVQKALQILEKKAKSVQLQQLRQMEQLLLQHRKEEQG